MEINDIRCHEEEVVAIGEIPGGCIAMVSSDNMMERHGESQIHLNLPSGKINGGIMGIKDLSYN